MGTVTQTPEKGRHRRPFSSSLTGRLRVLPDAVSILLSSRSSFPSNSARKGAKPLQLWSIWQGSVSGPYRGIGGGPQQADFQRKSQVHMHLPCLPLFKNGKKGNSLYQ